MEAQWLCPCLIHPLLLSIIIMPVHVLRERAQSVICCPGFVYVKQFKNILSRKIGYMLMKANWEVERGVIIELPPVT